jgi:hypothetical protein
MEKHSARVTQLVQELLSALNLKFAPRGAIVFLWDGETIPGLDPEPALTNGKVN